MTDPAIPPPAIHVEDVTLTFGGGTPVRALQDVSLRVEPGQFVSLVGPSGCGKSTLLRILAGLARPQRGEAAIEGISAMGRPGLAAFMPQRDLLLPWRRAVANAALGAELAGVPAAEARAEARRLLPQFGLEGFERAWPAQLSGGMRQRLALLRTCLLPRDVMLLDEPFGALDAITRREMQQWLQAVWQEHRRTVLLVTHDVEEALVLSDVVFVMSPRPGRIVHRVEVPLPRPRTSDDTATTDFAARKAQLLRALETAGNTAPVGIASATPPA
ncbi:MAG: ABC transporter ATP-binding protein [Dehalococcoidia bacterium]|nr:ABC transporter ATP-binding protein [Dehalococcoidia bacterium]